MNATQKLLERALRILELVSLRDSSVSYGQLREQLDISDTSLTRLLKALVANGWLATKSKRGYLAGNRIRDFIEKINFNPHQNEMNEITSSLSRQTQISCAWAMLQGDDIKVMSSINAVYSVAVMPKGGILLPEWDHAASLSVLRQCDDEVVLSLIKQSNSTLKSIDHLMRSVRRFSKKEVLFDQSQVRSGVSRMAVGFFWKGKPASLFLCGTTLELEQRFSFFSDLLLEARQDLVVRGAY